MPDCLRHITRSLERILVYVPEDRRKGGDEKREGLSGKVGLTDDGETFCRLMDLREVGEVFVQNFG